MSGLFQSPQVFRETCDSSGWIEYYLGTIQTEGSRSFWKMAVIAYVDANLGD
jgi:hypothetical protein